MREAVHDPAAAGIDEFSPTVAPTARREPGDATEAATGVPRRDIDAGDDELLGQVLAERYRIERPLGAGGMGTVYVGTHLTLGRKVAIKVIQPRLGADARIAQRFVQEARAASAIGHEHIVQITDFGALPPRPGAAGEGGSFLVMEYLEGEDLAQTLRRDGPLPWPRVIHIGEQIAWALAAAHRHDIVHRDIKPANCYRVPREQDPDFIKVLDFGLAKDLGEQRPDGEALTHTGMLLGTPGYIAPELYRGLKADHRVDIYALGALMHKLLTGELPPMGGGESDALPGLPAPDAVVAVLARALREAPDQRHGSAQELALALRALRRAAGDEPTLVGGAASPDPNTPRAGERTPAPRLEPASEPGPALREPTPTPFASLVTVERDGQKVRLSLGAPAFLMVMAVVGLTVYFLTRRAAEAPGRAPVPAAAEPAALQVAAAGPAARPRPARSGAARTEAVASPASEAPEPEPAPVAAVQEPAPPPDEADEAKEAVGADEPASGAMPDEPVGEATPDEPAAPAARPSKGSTRALGKLVTRQCARDSSFHYEIGVSWATDAEGLIRRDTVSLDRDQPQPVSKNMKDCVLFEIRRSKFQWKPEDRYAVRIEVGKRPAG